MFDFSDKLNEDEDILKSEIKRTVKMEGQTVLNLSLSLMENADINISFNFHTVTKTAEDFLEYLNKNTNFIYATFNKSKDILSNIYKLEIQMEDE